MPLFLIIVTAIGMSLASLQSHASREHIRIVGSSTVYPFTTTVAERFGRISQFRTPVVEITGSGSGLLLFCSGLGIRTIDMTSASRPIKASEVELCQGNGVDDILALNIGHDGIVVAHHIQQPALSLSRNVFYLALAKRVPNPDGSASVVDNPYQYWRDIHPALPQVAIEVLGPPPTSGTRDAWVELVMEGGCQQFDFIRQLQSTDPARYQALCHTMREDGAFIEAGENDNVIVQQLLANPHALGIFGFGFLQQNRDKVRSVAIDGVLPTFNTIADGSYPITRSLFLYVKRAHIGVIPGIEAFLEAYLSDAAMGQGGYLAERGLVPMLDEARANEIKRIRQPNKASAL
ncbi:MAG: substrate-binding domain-containing protein [Bacterioplanes sp.]|nr:substrate-binding domain-containing protein [Bacterioplanes sp.]